MIEQRSGVTSKQHESTELNETRTIGENNRNITQVEDSLEFISIEDFMEKYKTVKAGSADSNLTPCAS